MSNETVKQVIEKVKKMTEANERFEDDTLQNFAITIDYLLKERSRKEDVLASASAMLALDEYRKGLEKQIEYAKLGGYKERQAILLEILEQIDKELKAAVTMKLYEHTDHESIVNAIKQAILEHLAPTLGRGKWHAREQDALQQIISKVMEGYFVVKMGN